MNMKMFTEAKEEGVVTATFTKAQYDDLKKSQRCYEEEKINKGFLDSNGNHCEYEYKDYEYHTGMTNEEFYKANDLKALENCQKCPMWEKRCRTHEHTVITEKCITDKHVDELTKEIDQRILERIK